MGSSNYEKYVLWYPRVTQLHSLSSTYFKTKLIDFENKGVLILLMDENEITKQADEECPTDSKPFVRLLLTESDTIELYNKRSCCMVITSQDDGDEKYEVIQKSVVEWKNMTYKSDKTTQTQNSKCCQVYKHKST